jgi:hypothetical protein
VLDSEDVREFFIEAGKNRDFTAADLARGERINKKDVSVDKIERVLSKHGLKCLKKRIMQGLSN